MTHSKTRFEMEGEDMHKTRIIRCLNLMQQTLRKDICILEDCGTERTDIDQQSINQYPV